LFPSCEGGEDVEDGGVVVLWFRTLEQDAGPKTTTRSLRSPPSFAGGQLAYLIKPWVLR